MIPDWSAILIETADSVAAALAGVSDWGPSGVRTGQYQADLVADAAALAVLDRYGCGVLSEESGLTGAERAVTVIVDPLDGSTNASIGVPWYAISLCAVRDGVAIASVVRNLATGEHFEAVAGGGARRNGAPIAPSGCEQIGEAMIVVSGLPPHHLGWRQFRSLGALALDLCSVACGRFDGYIDCSPDAHGVWDYAGALLVCAEAGVPLVDAFGRDLLELDHAVRRTPVAAATAALADELIGARREF